MSREQIDEMAKVLINYTKKNHIMASHVILKDYAEALYNAGYRKQSVGEWIVCGMFDDFFKCSICGDMHPWQTAIEYKFCPNCGAKMRKG